MKTRVLKKVSAILLAVLILSLAGCVTDVYEPQPEPEPTPKPEPPKPDGPIWDLSTEKEFTLNVKYDVPEDYKVSFYVYAENPLYLDENRQIVKKDIEPIFAGFTDGNGSYSHKITFPSAVKTLYIYSDNFGVPPVLIAEVNGDILSDAEFPEDGYLEKTKSMVLRADDDYKKADYNQFAAGFSVKRLGYWQNTRMSLHGKYQAVYGRPDYLSSSKVEVDARTFTTIGENLPENGNATQFSSGAIHVAKDANVDVYILESSTSARNIMGYYFYKTGTTPIYNDIKDNVTVLFPNARCYPAGTVALDQCEGVRLKYTDGTNVIPAGTSIGWVIYNDGYSQATKGQRLNKGYGEFYSAPGLNKGKNRVATFRIDQFVVMGMEDWTDNDCNDVVFHVVSNPIDAITDEIPNVKSKVSGDGTVGFGRHGTLAFEDLWPDQGDFDMNDVVVKYDSEVTLNSNNQIIKTVDKFILLWSGATIHNGFAYQLDGVKRADVDVSISGDFVGGLDQSLDIATIRVFDDALTQTGNNSKTCEVTVTTTYKKPINSNKRNLPPYNPFITPTSVEKEVHLTNYPPTLLANPINFGKGNDESVYGQGIYYVTHVGSVQMPFAIVVPDYSGQEFVIPKESERIEVYYPGFTGWVTSGGTQNTDWYLNPVDKKPEEPVLPDPKP